MKVLFFCNLVPNKLGAFEWLLTTLGTEFRAGGDALVLVLADEPIAAVADGLRAQGVRWHCIRGWSEGEGNEHPWRFCLPALRLLREERPDVAVVHFGNELPTLLVGLLARLGGPGGVRWVWQQDQQIREPSALTARLSRLRLLRLCVHRFVAVYDGGKASMLRRGIPARAVSVIYNALKDQSPQRPRGWLREESSLPPDAVILVTVGWLVPRKRIDFTLEAFARACGPAGRPLHLFVVGEGPEAARLTELAASLGIGERVRFLGRRDDVRDILHEADLLVHSSVAETCTYAISESMSVGIPAVVTEAGAAREQIEDGRSGYVVGKHDAPAFTDRLLELVNDPQRRARYGAAARKRWEARYRVEVSARKYHELYRCLAAGKEFGSANL